MCDRNTLQADGGPSQAAAHPAAGNRPGESCLSTAVLHRDCCHLDDFCTRSLPITAPFLLPRPDAFCMSRQVCKSWVAGMPQQSTNADPDPELAERYATLLATLANELLDCWKRAENGPCFRLGSTVSGTTGCGRTFPGAPPVAKFCHALQV